MYNFVPFPQIFNHSQSHLNLILIFLLNCMISFTLNSCHCSQKSHYSQSGSDRSTLGLKHSLKLKAYFFHLGQYLLFMITVVKIIKIWTIYPVWLLSTVGKTVSLCLLFLAFSWLIFHRQSKGERQTHTSLISSTRPSLSSNNKKGSLTLSLPSLFMKIS